METSLAAHADTVPRLPPHAPAQAVEERTADEEIDLAELFDDPDLPSRSSGLRDDLTFDDDVVDDGLADDPDPIDPPVDLRTGSDDAGLYPTEELYGSYNLDGPGSGKRQGEESLQPILDEVSDDAGKPQGEDTLQSDLDELPPQTGKRQVEEALQPNLDEVEEL